MRVLFDEGVPTGLKASLAHHDVYEAREIGLDSTANGELILAAEEACFDVLVTNDRRIRYQQNLTGRKLSLVVLEHPNWPIVQLVLREIVAAVDGSRAGSYTEVAVPFKRTRLKRRSL